MFKCQYFFVQELQETIKVLETSLEEKNAKNKEQEAALVRFCNLLAFVFKLKKSYLLCKQL